MLLFFSLLFPLQIFAVHFSTRPALLPFSKSLHMRIHTVVFERGIYLHDVHLSTTSIAFSLNVCNQRICFSCLLSFSILRLICFFIFFFFRFSLVFVFVLLLLSASWISFYTFVMPHFRTSKNRNSTLSV